MGTTNQSLTSQDAATAAPAFNMPVIQMAPEVREPSTGGFQDAPATAMNGASGASQVSGPMPVLKQAPPPQRPMTPQELTSRLLQMAPPPQVGGYAQPRRAPGGGVTADPSVIQRFRGAHPLFQHFQNDRQNPPTRL